MIDFSIGSLIAVVTDPSAWLVIFSLVLLEGILSADNALVLAVLVKHLPEEQRKRALTYGILGAYAFRALAIFMGLYLIKFWWIKAIGAGYLLYLAYNHFCVDSADEEVGSISRSFWMTVATVEIMDITFSIDSILAAFGVSDKAWVLYLGGMLGILMMRGVARVFIELLNRYPEFEHTAYILIALIGTKLGVSCFGVHIPDMIFFGLMGIVFFGTFAVHKFKNKEVVGG